VKDSEQGLMGCNEMYRHHPRLYTKSCLAIVSASVLVDSEPPGKTKLPGVREADCAWIDDKVGLAEDARTP
jgi:hypothetical protein